MSAKRVAVILFNLGGPDTPKAVWPFLYNLFRDRNIMRIPQPWRTMVAGAIATVRSPTAKQLYAQMGGGSPILPNTQAQSDALEALLNQRAGQEVSFRCFVAMRYWHPMSDETARAVRDWQADEAVLLPLYPQYSTATTRSSLEAWDRAVHRIGLDIPTRSLCCWPREPGFIETSARLIAPELDRAARHGKPRLVFSAHSLPEKFLDAGEPYVWQIERSAEAIVQRLERAHKFDWRLSYQSKVGPIPWVGPSTESVLRMAAADGAPVVVYPLSFVSEHVETLVEIGHEYRELAGEIGIPYFGAVDTVGVQPEFIAGLSRMVEGVVAGAALPGCGKRVCPSGFACGHGLAATEELNAQVAA